MVEPVIDGRDTSYPEWLYAGRVNLRHQYATLHRAEQCLQVLWYGAGKDQLFIRVDLDHDLLQRHPSWRLELTFQENIRALIEPAPPGVRAELITPSSSIPLRAALDRIFEVAIPIGALNIKPDEPFQVAVCFYSGMEALERYPAQGFLPLRLGEADVWPT